MLSIEALEAFSDNYIWLVRNPDTREAAVVDPGDAPPVVAWLEQHPDWRLMDILITHHHQDHIGGIGELVSRYGARVIGPATEQIPARSLGLSGGERIEILGTSVEVIALPGHTLGHIGYYGGEEAPSPWLFCGDTLFAGGCGRLFEGTPQQMFESLSRLARLPGPTRVFCAHEYTQSNLRFANAVEPHNTNIQTRLELVSDQRSKNLKTLPSSISEELATNPFLRTGEAAVREAAQRQGVGRDASGAEVFAALRRWKDHF